MEGQPESAFVSGSRHVAFGWQAEAEIARKSKT